MSRKLKKYSKEYKLSLLREYYSSGMTKYAFEKEHNLAPVTFLRWLSTYESEKNATFAGPNRAAWVLRFQQNQHVKNISTTFTLVSIDSVWLLQDCLLLLSTPRA